MDPLFSTLLSIAGQNRAIGTGDVVPYQRSTSDSPTASQAQAATPGPSSPGPAFDPNSSLANLSALLPQYNAALAAQIAGAIPSGTASAVAQPLPVATPGPGSSDVSAAAQTIGAAPVAGTPGAGLGSVSPATTPASGSGPATSAGGSTPSGAGDSGPAGSASGVGDSGDAGVGTGAAAGGIGDSSAGVSGGEAGIGGIGDSGDGGVGDGGAGDGGGGDGGASGGGDGAMKRGGFVTKGDPNSKTDDVNAKLQHGEFVIPRAAVIHLAAHAPQVLSHVMHVSAMHHLANQAKNAPSPGAMLTGQNGGLPPQGMRDGGPVGYRNGGLVVPGGAQVHPAALDLIRRAIAAHSAAQRPMVAPSGAPQMATAVSPPMASVAKPAAVPPMERMEATKNATGGSRGSMGRKPTQV